MPTRREITTTKAGLGWAHQKRRGVLLDRHVDGTPCAVCGRPMYRSQRLQADHSVPRALGGTEADRLLHGRCNESRGARLGNRMRTRRRSVPRALPEW